MSDNIEPRYFIGSNGRPLIGNPPSPTREQIISIRQDIEYSKDDGSSLSGKKITREEWLAIQAERGRG